MKKIEEYLRYFPMSLTNILYEILDTNENILNNLQEIRLRVDRPIILKLRNNDLILEYKVSQTEILQTLERLCENSIYAYKNQICEGFITVSGGHRVGLTGSCVIENGKIINIKYISSLNFRIAREVLNCSNKILKDILDIQNKSIFNTVIVAPPGKGKTTILRDTVRRISDGIEEIGFPGKVCGLVDERGEIAACYKGIPQNNVGIRTDVIENISKDKGIRILIRTMSPEVIACDEIGSKEDIEAIKYALFSGVKGIFTMHGKKAEDIRNNKNVYELIENKSLQKVIFL